MAKLNDHTLLIADSMKGVIWSLDINTGKSVVALDDESLKAGHDEKGNYILSGINGLRIDNDSVYYTNSATGALSKVAIDCKTGEIKGKVETLAKGMLNADDFAIGREGKIYVTRNKESLVEVQKDGEKADVAGLGANEVPGPTSATFERANKDKDVLYVSTIGRVNGTFIEGGKIVAITV
jgi:sugar lactone lactonase YvrE